MGNSFDSLNQSEAGNFSESNNRSHFTESPSDATPALKISEETKEKLLNGGYTVENIQPSVEQITLTPELVKAFENLRHGYPDLPMEQQTQGHEFRLSSELITDEIAKKTLENLDPSKVVVLMPWRAGLAFANAYKKLGVNRFYHLSSARDHHTLQTIVNFQQGEVSAEDTVIIADPMLATGNTTFDAIERVKSQNVLPENIIINALVAAPVGVSKAKITPETKVVVGMLDEKLDHRGYIVPGLGDFGDKYFHQFSTYQLHTLAANLGLDDQVRKQLFIRFGLPQ